MEDLHLEQPFSTRSLKMEVYEDEEAVGAAAAALVAEQVRQKPESVLLLPTGRTPLLMYSRLIELVQHGELNLTQIQTFNLDEFYGIPAAHPGSYHTYMRHFFFEKVGVPESQTRLLNGAVPDAVSECAAYENEIRAAGGIDLAVLGIGANGHIGFNEPGSSLQSRTRLVELRSESRQANAFLFGDRLEEVPQAALTAGIATIMEARRVVLLATGEGKARAVRQMLSGAVTADVPASFLRLHPDLILLADREAGA